MKKLLILFFAFIAAQGIGQNTSSLKPLKEDITFRKGVLDNGLTYYIYPTTVNKGRASFYLLQNVGSILEEDNEKGLAHFLEHMAFNGTQHFEGKGVLTTLQKYGAVFGKDINAYTSYDETVYNINNLPTTPETIDTALLILSDWCDGLLLDENEIDAERGVIREEARSRESGAMRVYIQSLPALYNNSKYVERMPIGSMDIIENFDFQELKDFYNRWYRTDLQAIAVIGDIHTDSIEKKIQTLFSKIPRVKNPEKRTIQEIPSNRNLHYVLAMDKEVNVPFIQFGIRHPKMSRNKTQSDFKKTLLRDISLGLLNQRIEEVIENPDSPLTLGRISYSGHSPSTDAFIFSISPKPDKQSEAFERVLTEVNRAILHGFSENEIQRRKDQILEEYQNKIAKKEDLSHYQIFSAIHQNYFEGIVLTDIKEEFNIVKEILKNVEPFQLAKQLEELYTPENRFLIVTGVATQENLGQEEALEIIKEIENDSEILPYQDNFNSKDLTADVTIPPGSIIAESYNNIFDSYTFELSNGVTVHYKYSDKTKNDVKLKGISHGGLSRIPESELPSANLTPYVAKNSGLGEYSISEVKKIMAGKTANTSIGMTLQEEYIHGSSSTKDVESLLQMVYLRFNKPRFDMDAYKVSMDNFKNYVEGRKKNINEKIKDSVIINLYGKNHKLMAPYDSQFVKEISFDNISTIYKNRFKDPSDFEFFIVGDVKAENLKPLLEKYLASIPTQGISEKEYSKNPQWLQNSIKKEILLEMKEPIGSVKLGYRGTVPYTLRNELLTDIFEDILTLRYTESIREKEGGTYGVSTRAKLEKATNEVNLTVSFTCDPNKVEQLLPIAYKEIEKIANGQIVKSDLEKTVQNFLMERERLKNYNQYDLEVLETFYRNGYNMEDPKNFEKILEEIEPMDVSAFAKNFLEDAAQYELIFKPTEKVEKPN